MTSVENKIFGAGLILFALEATDTDIQRKIIQKFHVDNDEATAKLNFISSGTKL